MRRLRSDPLYFEQGTPMGSEVLEWLQVQSRPEAGPSIMRRAYQSRGGPRDLRLSRALERIWRCLDAA